VIENLVNLQKTAGRIISIKGFSVISDIQNVRIGDTIEVLQRDGIRTGEVIGFEENRSIIMMHNKTSGISQGSILRLRGNSQKIPIGKDLLGRVLDANAKVLFGNEIYPERLIDVFKDQPDPLRRRKISEIFETGIRTIDGLLTLGKGQRVGLFAGSGVGKSKLLGNITRFAKADIVVVNLIGERGRWELNL